MRKLLTLAIPMLLGVGLLTAAIHKDPQNGEQSKRLQAGFADTRSQPAVVEEAAAPTTATTAAPETTTTTAAPAPTTTTTLAIVTTTTARRVVTPVTAPRPRPTTTTTFQQTQAAAEPTIIDCGTGSANAKANLVNLGGGRYGLTATVINESTKDIELDSLVVSADYGAAGKKQFNAAVSGKIVEARPGQSEVTFSIPESEGSGAPSNFVISDFRFHTAGMPECTSH